MIGTDPLALLWKHVQLKGCRWCSEHRSSAAAFSRTAGPHGILYFAVTFACCTSASRTFHQCQGVFRYTAALGGADGAHSTFQCQGHPFPEMTRGF